MIQRDKIIGSDEVRGDKHVTVLGSERPLICGVMQTWRSAPPRDAERPVGIPTPSVGTSPIPS